MSHAHVTRMHGVRTSKEGSTEAILVAAGSCALMKQNGPAHTCRHLRPPPFSGGTPTERRRASRLGD
jgi:hypothetical protein